ncbi:copper chaperone PCu(A)C [Thalassospira povalilytica]|uniref:Copper chaperone PCu(A)C n=1 Tax=Thalassospira povalilytica TaxID=732237 RepID=A0A8I1MAY9_9PROT|nr:copper chaperone PCu(A)C [Thalassospira povalilytica]MBN8198081.1 copper chaperone PCu(A)C [Thalassospira povalilytica]
MKKLFAVLATLASLFVVTNAFAADIEIKDAWAKASLGQVRNGAAFLTVVNHGGADRIIGVRSDLADKTELHTHIMANNVMKMRQVEGGIDVPMHGEVLFKPGSYHVMMMGLKKPLEQGEMIQVTLEFEKAGDIPVMIHVMDAMAKGPAGMDHGQMDHNQMEHGQKDHGGMNHNAN